MDHASQTPPAPAARPRRSSRGVVLALLLAFAVVSVVGGTLYLLDARKYVYTDKAQLEAPLIGLASRKAGVLKRVTVEEGDTLYAGEAVGRVGDEMLSTRIEGVAVTVRKDIGASVAAGEPVVTMIDPSELRVVARIEEDKGLQDILEGQRAVFTVDAFGSREFEGTVASVSATSRDQDVVFNISDKRETREFEVKIDYDHAAYEELRNGMSARVWIVR